MASGFDSTNYTLAADEKAANVMVYTACGLLRGDMVVKAMVRVSTMLRMNTAPNRICLYDAVAMTTTSANPPRAYKYNQYVIATSQIIGFHLVPPDRDPIDYDPKEPNRRMEQISVLLGTFRIDGKIRLSEKLSIAQSLEYLHDPFLSVYDAVVCNPLIPSLGSHHVPHLLVRQEAAGFGAE